MLCILIFTLGNEDYSQPSNIIRFDQFAASPYCGILLITNDNRKETLFENFTVTLQPYSGTQPVLSTNLVVDDTHSFVIIEDDDRKILKLHQYIYMYISCDFEIMHT